MRRTARRIGAVGLFAAALVLGCKHADHPYDDPPPCSYANVAECPPDNGSASAAPATNCTPMPQRPTPAPVTPAAPNPVPPPSPPRKAPPGYLPDLVQTPQGSGQWATVAPPAAPADQPRPAPRPTTLEVAESSETPPVRPTPPPPRSSPSSDIIIHEGPPCPTETKSAPAFAETDSAGMGFGHAPDYSCLRGQVERSLRGVRLRFAPVDQVDRYGGSVTLIGPLAEQLRDSQSVRVRGQLLNPDAQSPAPDYRVLSIEMVHE
jgi:hypothetical protein